MRDEFLFIDGELVDLDDSTRITLKYVSNIFTDLNKIVSNNSYTIKLPDTVRNQRVIEHADLPSCDTDYPRRVHEARYFRNGIEIISKAEAILMLTGRSFDMAMIWGNKTSFASVVNNGKKLTDLSSGTVEGEDYAVWKNWGAFSERFPNINYGFNSGEANVWHHPVVKAKWILDKIQKENKVNFQFSEEKLRIIDKMIIPLLGRNDSQTLYDKYPLPVNFVGYKNVVSVSYLKLEFGGDNTQVNFGSVTGYYQDQFSFNWDSDVVVSGNLSITVDEIGDQYKKELLLQVKENDSLGNTKVITRISKYPKSAYLENGKVILEYEFNDKVHVKDKNFIDVIYQKTDIASVNHSRLLLKIGTKGDVSFNEKFPFSPNLPDMKQIDFIKAISQILGVFAVPVGDDTIKFVSVDDIIANKSKAVNWTKKVIASSYENKPMSMNFILDGFARNNRFKWKEDETVKGNYDSSIVVNDNTIEYERDAVTLPFAASDSKGEVAYIPIYSYKEDGSLNYSKNAKPKLLYLDGVKGVFTGLSWDKLIAENYSNYVKVVSYPRIITEKIEIGDIDLKNLDVTVPAYLGQYGRYYAIISVRAEDSGICECKLLQLEV